MRHNEPHFTTHAIRSEALIFKTIERQRQIVSRAASKTRQIKSARTPRRSQLKDTPWPAPARTGLDAKAAVDYSKEPEESDGEIW